MPQIPDYTSVGIDTPQVSPRRVYPDESGQIISRAVEGFGNTLQQVGVQDYQQQQRALTSRANDALLDHQLQTTQTVADIRDKVQSGKLPWDQAEQAYKDATSAPGMQLPDVTGLDPDAAAATQRQAQRQQNAGLLEVQGIARAGRKQAVLDDTQTAFDTLAKNAAIPGPDQEDRINDANTRIGFYRQSLLDAGVPAATVDKSIQSFKDKNWYNYAEQQFIQNKDNFQNLKLLERDLTEQNGFYADKLDADKRTDLMRSVTNGIDRLQQKAEIAEQRHEVAAQRLLSQAETMASTGLPFPDGFLAHAQAAVKGTSSEGELQGIVDGERQVQSVLRMPLDQQAKFIQDEGARLEQQGGTPKDLANYRRLTMAVQNNGRLMTQEPILWAQQRLGDQVQPLNMSGLNSPDGQQAIGQEVSHRMATIGALRQRYGAAVSPMPLLPQEAQALGGMLASSDSDTQAQLLSKLRQAIPDDGAFQATMGQVEPHSPVTAYAGSLIGRAAPAAPPSYFDPRYAPSQQDASAILYGESLLNPSKTVKAGEETGANALKSRITIPPDAADLRTGNPGFKQAFQDRVGHLFDGRPDAYDQAYQAYRAAYAGIAAKAGKMDGSMDLGLQQKALNIAVGRTAQYGGTMFSSGHTVSVPTGMNPSDFDANLSAGIAAQAQRLGAPAGWADKLGGYTAVDIGPPGSGLYAFVNGNQYLAVPGGGADKFVVNLNREFQPVAGAPPGSNQTLKRYTPQ